MKSPRRIDRGLKPSEKLSVAVECFPNAFLLLDADDRIVFNNEAWRSQFAGVSDFTIPGTDFREFMRQALLAGLFPEAAGHEEEWLKNRMRNHLNPGEPFELECADGRWSLVNEQRLSEGGIMIVTSDITERKRAERTLRESEAFLHEAQRIAKISSWMWDEREDREVYRSGEDWRIFGLDRNDDLANSFEDFLDQVHPDDRDRVGAGHERRLRQADGL